MEKKGPWYAIAAAVLLSGCYWPGTLKHFETVGMMDRAAFELGCKATDIKAGELPGNTVGVTGCGKKAVYVWSPAAQSWVNNTGG